MCNRAHRLVEPGHSQCKAKCPTPCPPPTPPPPSPPHSPSPSPPNPSAPSCLSLEECKDECTTFFDTCVRYAEKKCKKKKKRCNKDCSKVLKCGNECDDNKIPGLGSFWCELNTSPKYVTESAKEEFCNTKHFKRKCMRTCGACES